MNEFIPVRNLMGMAYKFSPFTVKKLYHIIWSLIEPHEEDAIKVPEI